LVSVALLGLIGHPAIARAQGLGKSPPQVMIGVNFAEITFDSTSLGVDWSTGFAGGVDFTLPQPKNNIVSVHPEALFIQKGAHVTSTVDEHIRANYLEAIGNIEIKLLPTLLHDRIVLDIGPTVGFLLSASNDVNGQNISLTESVTRVDAGIMAGATVRVVDRLDVGVRFEQSFIDFFKDSSSDAKNRSLMILVTPHIIKD
jgi:type II secretory pathway component GspD/PulD (secretin)